MVAAAASLTSVELKIRLKKVMLLKTHTKYTHSTATVYLMMVAITKLLNFN